MAEEQTLRMTLPLTRLSAFFPLLQRGVWLQARVGCNVMELLAGQFGIAEKYITERITTLFLDGKAIDDLESSYIRAGSTVALSSAMPGLVGATMRRGGHLAAMREAITYHGRKPELSGTGRVRIKLFNMVMAELGEKILSHGVFLTNPELSTFLNEQQIDRATLDSHVCLADPTGEVLVKVEFKG